MTRVGIVGYGRFGRALADLVRLRGAELSVFERDRSISIVPEACAAPSLAGLAASVDVLLVATPVPTMPDVFDALRGVFATLASAPLVMDVGSVKVAPVRALERAFGAGARAVGTHPLFGPKSLARAERPLTVVICQASSEAATREAEAFWSDLGCETIRVSADEHDRVMARTHALAFFFAKGIVDAGLDDATPFAPPSYQAIARSVEAVRSDAGHLFRSIEVDNPFAAGVRSSILRALTAADAELVVPESGEGAPHGAGATMSLLPVGEREPARAPSSESTQALAEARSLIDDVDREIVVLLARRAELAERASRAKDALGIGTRDPTREAELLETRRAWAHESRLDPDAVRDVFEAILRFSRGHQRIRPRV